ncbi:hypothetical protein CMI37_27220 [Candidatus Pacearchaeota archaeon]|nr:hypothetical protein [Candidatus Pacearchaeota archaeon]
MKVREAIKQLADLDGNDELLIGVWSDTGAYNNYIAAKICPWENGVCVIDTKIGRDPDQPSEPEVVDPDSFATKLWVELDQRGKVANVYHRGEVVASIHDPEDRDGRLVTNAFVNVDRVVVHDQETHETLNK